RVVGHLRVPLVGDAVRGLPLPGDAPQPLPALADALRPGPFLAVLRGADEGVMVLDGVAAGRLRGAADDQQPSPGRDAQFRVAQIDVLALDQGGGLPLVAIGRDEDANSAGAARVAGSLAEGAVPAILKADEIGEGVVRRLVPDLLHLEELRLGRGDET